MGSRLKLLTLAFGRAVGLFRLARWLTRSRLRILCYHGGSIADEHRFRPGLFITEETFRRRLRMLAEGDYPILPLDEALQRLEAGTLPAAATVITIDDGWFGTYSLMAPALQSAGYPSTLYLSTYYLEKGTQVFNVAAAYVLWKRPDAVLDIAHVVAGGDGSFDLSVPAACRAALALLERAGDACDAQGRQELFRRLCEALQVDWRLIESRRQFGYMAVGEARSLAAQGIQVQLHTHRHRFPRDRGAAEAEIADNRSAIARISQGPTPHLCYPSGEYHLDQLQWLPSLGITSAVTTNRGLASRGSDRLALPRLLDSEILTDLEFEAEMSGFREVLRWLVPRSRRLHA